MAAARGRSRHRWSKVAGVRLHVLMGYGNAGSLTHWHPLEMGERQYLRVLPAGNSPVNRPIRPGSNRTRRRKTSDRVSGICRVPRPGKSSRGVDLFGRTPIAGVRECKPVG